jgi:hypothetical protein
LRNLTIYFFFLLLQVIFYDKALTSDVIQAHYKSIGTKVVVSATGGFVALVPADAACESARNSRADQIMTFVASVDQMESCKVQGVDQVLTQLQVGKYHFCVNRDFLIVKGKKLSSHQNATFLPSGITLRIQVFI